jgi:hypothetical protein
VLSDPRRICSREARAVESTFSRMLGAAIAACLHCHLSLTSRRMRECASATAPSEGSDEFYSLEKFASKSIPRTIKGLLSWLSAHHESGQWDAKIYVASSIVWNDDPPEFRQTGCSPNFHAGLWSLACCKYPMRGAQPFRGQVKDKTIPTFVFTLASKAPHEGFQALVSVAKVTGAFETMEEYARFLLDRGTRKLISSRLTRVRADDGLLGSRFGDCHADRKGIVGTPDKDHVHSGSNAWRNDVNGNHLILVSRTFLLWDRPVFITQRTIGQSRYGQNLTPENLEYVLISK